MLYYDSLCHIFTPIMIIEYDPLNMVRCSFTTLAELRFYYLFPLVWFLTYEKCYHRPKIIIFCLWCYPVIFYSDLYYEITGKLHSLNFGKCRKEDHVETTLLFRAKNIQKSSRVTCNMLSSINATINVKLLWLLQSKLVSWCSVNENEG